MTSFSENSYDHNYVRGNNDLQWNVPSFINIPFLLAQVPLANFVPLFTGKHNFTILFINP